MFRQQSVHQVVLEQALAAPIQNWWLHHSNAEDSTWVQNTKLECSAQLSSAEATTRMQRPALGVQSPSLERRAHHLNAEPSI